MMAILQNTWVQKIILLVAIGAVTVTVSEFWFYEVSTETSHVLIMLMYGILGYILIQILDKYKVRTFLGLFLAACLFGFLTEGVPVPVLYTGVPFTIVWTSMAWHAVITVVMFWYLWRKFALDKSLFTNIWYNVSLGLLLGLWTVVGWSGVETDSGITFDWVPTETVAEQFMTAFLFFILGHIAMSYVSPAKLSATKEEWAILGLITGFFYLVGQLLPLFPFSLVLLPLIWLCIYPLSKSHFQTQEGQETILESVLGKRIKISRYLCGLLIPIFALGSYHLCYVYQFGFETNALLIVTAGPLSVYWFARAWWVYIVKKN